MNYHLPVFFVFLIDFFIQWISHDISFLRIETVIDTQLWRNSNWCWHWNQVRPANLRWAHQVHRPKMRSFLSKKNYIRVVVCCLARLNVPGTEAKHNRTFLLLPVYRHYTQHFSVFILIGRLILTMKRRKKKREKHFLLGLVGRGRHYNCTTWKKRWMNWVSNSFRWHRQSRCPNIFSLPYNLWLSVCMCVSICRVIDLTLESLGLNFNVSTFFDESSNSSIFFLPKKQKNKQKPLTDMQTNNGRLSFWSAGSMISSAVGSTSTWRMKEAKRLCLTSKSCWEKDSSGWRIKLLLIYWITELSSMRKITANRLFCLIR